MAYHVPIFFVHSVSVDPTAEKKALPIVCVGLFADPLKKIAADLRLYIYDLELNAGISAGADIRSPKAHRRSPLISFGKLTKEYFRNPYVDKAIMKKASLRGSDATRYGEMFMAAEILSLEQGGLAPAEMPFYGHLPPTYSCKRTVPLKREDVRDKSGFIAEFSLDTAIYFEPHYADFFTISAVGVFTDYLL